MLHDIAVHQSHTGHRVEMPSVERRNQRSLSMETSEMPECYITVRRSPKLSITHLTYPGDEDAFHEAILLWILAGMKDQSVQKPVTRITGFLSKISKTGKIPDSLTTINYYPVTASPITEYKTVQECLRYAESSFHLACAFMKILGKTWMEVAC